MREVLNHDTGEGSVQVAESEVQNGSAQATLVMSSLRDVAHTFVNDFYAGKSLLNNILICNTRKLAYYMDKKLPD